MSGFENVRIYLKKAQTIPNRQLPLFMALLIAAGDMASTGHYADDPDCGQLVTVDVLHRKTLLDACGWQTANPLYKGLQVLCECGAIEKIGANVYRINREYAVIMESREE